MKVLLVDDERLICNWLTMLINQLGRSDVCVDSVYSAEDALLYCATHAVDLVITDINMPQKSGLELLSDLAQSHPEIKTAVLSAYDDYKYIRESLKKGSLDYILKSELNEADILALMNKVDMAYELESFKDSSENKLQDKHHLLEKNSRTLNLFLQENLSIDAFSEKICVDFAKDKLPGLVLFNVCDVSTYSEKKGMVAEVLNRTLKNDLLDGAVFFINSTYFLVLINNLSNIKEHQESMLERVSLLGKRNIEEYTGCTVTAVISSTVKEKSVLMKTINTILDEAAAIAYYECQSGTKILPLDETEADKLNQDVVKLLRAKKFHEAFVHLQNFIEAMHIKKVNPQDIKRITVLLLATLNSSFAFSKRGKLMLDSFDSLIREVQTSTTQSELMSHIHSFHESCLVSADTKSKYSDQVKTAIDYIEENYRKKITIDDIAAHVYLNKSYLSQIFMQQVGVSIGTYIETVRMKSAIEMLAREDMSVAEISSLTGYSSQGYFAKVFNKYTGVSPKEYQKAFGKKADSNEDVYM